MGGSTIYQLTVSRHQGGSYQFFIREPEVYILQELWSIIRMLRTMEKTDPHMGELADSLAQWTHSITAINPSDPPYQLYDKSEALSIEFQVSCDPQGHYYCLKHLVHPHSSEQEELKWIEPTV